MKKSYSFKAVKKNLSEEIEDVKKGNFDRARVTALIRATGLIISCTLLELEIHKQGRNKPNIED